MTEAVLAEAPAFDATALLADALPVVETAVAEGRAALRARVSAGARISNAALEGEQHAAHSLSWIATYQECLVQMSAWAGRLAEAGAFGEMESLILQIGAGEYLAQLKGGLIMSQGEIARLSDALAEAEPLVRTRLGDAGRRLVRQLRDRKQRIQSRRNRLVERIGARDLDPPE